MIDRVESITMIFTNIFTLIEKEFLDREKFKQVKVNSENQDIICNKSVKKYCK